MLLRAAKGAPMPKGEKGWKLKWEPPSPVAASSVTPLRHPTAHTEHLSGCPRSNTAQRRLHSPRTELHKLEVESVSFIATVEHAHLRATHNPTISTEG